MDGAEVVDLVVFIFCIAVLVAYHLWYFFRGRWGKPNKWQVGRRRRRHYVDMWSTSVKSRGLWAVAMMAGDHPCAWHATTMQSACILPLTTT